MGKTEKVFVKVKERLESESFITKHRIKNNYFCRDRKLNFYTVIITLINKLSKSLNVEISKFMLNFKQGDLATKQAFSKARYKLDPEAFVDLNDTFVEAYYSSNTHRLYANKYLVLAVDGSYYELPWFEDIVEEFGFANNPVMNFPKAMATGVKIWDLLNELSVVTKLGKYKESETAIFDGLWPAAAQCMKNWQPAPILLVADAYYSGLGRMLELIERGVEFIMRCEYDFCREVLAFMEGEASQAVLQIDLASDHRRRWRLKKRGICTPPTQLKLRAVRLRLNDGTQVCLLSSIVGDELSEDQIMEIYSFRYGEEVSFYIEKFRTQVENFATKMAKGIYQEWYANILCLNMTQLLVEEAQKELDIEQLKKPKKYYYKINKSAAIGIVKDEIPKLLFGIEDSSHFIQRMIKIIYKFKEPVRPQRSFPRKTKHKLKYHMNQRKVL